MAEHPTAYQSRPPPAARRSAAIRGRHCLRSTEDWIGNLNSRILGPGSPKHAILDGLVLQTSIIAVTSRWGTSVRHMPDASLTAFVEHRCCNVYITLPLSGTPSRNRAVRRPHRPIACLFREFAAMTRPKHGLAVEHLTVSCVARWCV